MTALAPALRSQLTGLAGTVAFPGDEAYAGLCSPWNLAIATTPLAVVGAGSADEVARVVAFANEHHIPVAVQASGHGAFVPVDDAILVVTRALDEVTIHAEERWARVGAGVRWQAVLDAAAPFGLAALAGSSPSVSVVGYTTGGGHGPLARTLGLASDRVRAFDVVTGDGVLRRATPTEEPDLFWGLRGGKATLGIVASVEIDLPELAGFYGGAVYFDGAHACDVLHAWARWCPELPESVSTSIALLQLPDLPEIPAPLAGRFVVAVRYAAVGDRGQALDLLTPMRAVAPALMDAVAELPYAAIGAVHMDPPHPMPVYEDHTLLSSLPAEAVDALLALAGPGVGSAQAMVEVRQLGGAFARWPRQRSAFCHRDTAFAVTTIGAPVPELAVPVRQHAAAVMAALEPWSTGRQLPNFAPAADPGRLARCYDDDTLYQLAALAERYDPKGVLRVAQVARYPF